MKKITLLMVALLLSVMGANAKTKTTTLWEDTYSDNIQIPVANLVQGATITVSASVTASENADDKKLRVFYCKNDANWTQTSFTDISDWVELSVGETSHSFTVTEAAMNILNDDTETTGSRGIMYIGACNKDHLTITKITQTVTIEPASTSNNLLNESWASSTESAKIFAPVSDAKIGDVLQFTVTTTEAWKWVQFKLTDKNGQVNKFTGDGSEPKGSNANTSFTLEFVISTVADLVKIMSDGFGVIQTGENTFTLTAVKLLSYSDSHDAVEEVEMGSDGIMTYSNIYNLDFSDTGLTPYYTTSATTGKVTLTTVADKTTWNYQGYILKGNEGTYHPKVIGNNSGTYPNDNLLKGNTGEKLIAASTTETYHYIFAKDNGGKIGFFNLASDYTLGAHKAYLETDTDIKPGQSGSSRIALVFGDGDTTGIQELENSSIEELKNSGNEALKAYYNLNGQRVANPRKGLYVVNGKKVIIK